MFYFFLYFLYKLYQKFLEKSKKTAIRQAQEHNRVAGGYITGSGLVFASVAGMRGLFRHEIVCEFPVIVAEQSDFHKYKGKRMKFLYIFKNSHRFQSYLQNYTKISAVFSRNGLCICVFR